MDQPTSRGQPMLIESTAAARAGQHLCQRYRSEQSRRAAVSDFVRAGLSADELVVHVSSSDEETIGAYLDAAGIDAAAAFRRRQLQVITLRRPADDASARASVLAEVGERLQCALDERATLGFAVARLSSEVDEVYGAGTRTEMVARERGAEQLFGLHPMVVLCLYDSRRHATDFLLDVELEHEGQVVPGADVYRDDTLAVGRLHDDATLWVAGAVDLSNRDGFAAALERATADRFGDIVVDLSGASYLDVGGLQLLVDTARRDPGRRVVVLKPSRLVAETLQLAGWDDLPGLIVSDG